MIHTVCHWMGKTNYMVRNSRTLMWLAEVYMSQFLVFGDVLRVFLVIGIPVIYLVTQSIYDAVTLYVAIIGCYLLFLFYSLFICLAIADGATYQTLKH